MGFAQGFDVYDVEKKNDRRVWTASVTGSRGQ